MRLREIAARGHDLLAEDCLPLVAPRASFDHPEFPDLVDRIRKAHQDNRPVIAIMGAHPIKLGLSRFLIDLLTRRSITHLATNGAGIIHDFELATLGGTTENVARWIQRGQFGLWHETSRLNEIVADAAARNEGIGEAVGRTLEEEQASHRGLSLTAAGWRAGVPITSHVGIGSDILHAHANFDAAAWGKASDIDFLILAHSIQQLEGGVLLNFGSAVTGPEVFLKALSMARNVAHQENRTIRRFTTAVFDLIELPDTWRNGPPSKDHPHYYYRPWKTLLHRTVADGAASFYFRGDHRTTIPSLWEALSN